jgi:hypothetical protein
MRLLVCLMLVPIVVHAETIFIESEITTLLKSTYSIHAGTSVGMERGEVYATYMHGVGSWPGYLDFRQKTWGVGFRRYNENHHQGKFWGLALRTADVDDSCTSLVDRHRFYKHTAAIVSYGKRVTTAGGTGSLRSHVSWVFELGRDQVSSNGNIEKQWIYGISLNWGLSFL